MLGRKSSRFHGIDKKKKKLEEIYNDLRRNFKNLRIKLSASAKLLNLLIRLSRSFCMLDHHFQTEKENLYHCLLS